MAVIGSEAAAASMFGDTDRAGGVPDGAEAPSPAAGPVYMEGRLVLSLSFRGDGAAPGALPAGDLLERYVIWDHAAGERAACTALELLRYEMADAVVDSGADGIVWTGRVDTKAPIIEAPDLDDEGFEANRGRDLRWKLMQ